MPFTIVTVTGTIHDASGNPAPGVHVQFTLSAGLVSTDDGTIASPSPIAVQTGTDGTFSVPLVATDDSNTVPLGQNYKCVIRIPSAATIFSTGTFPAFYFPLPAADAPTVDISHLITY